MRKRYTQIKLPSPDDHDPHPRLMVDGYGIHAGESFRARFPDGWHDITLEVAWEITGPGCWYISTPGYSDVCPVGLFVEAGGAGGGAACPACLHNIRCSFKINIYI